MPEFVQMFQRQRKYLLFLLAFFILGWGFTPYKPVFLGLFIGTTASLYNLWLMYKKTNQFGEVVVHGGKMRSLGLLSRMAAAGLVVFIAIKKPDQIHLVSMVIGLMTSYIVIMIDFFIQLIFKRPEER